MSTAGPNNPSANAYFSGVVATNPQNAYTHNSAFATFSLSASPNDSSTYFYTGFGFSLPAGANVDDIQVEAEAKRDASGTGQIYLGLVLAGSQIGFANLGGTLTTSVVYYSVNGLDASHLNAHPTATEVNGSDFGAVVNPIRLTLTPLISIDHVRMTITYTLPSGIHMTQVRQAVQRAAVR